jgi:2,3-bisphosphoglycerate-independent phosphoglycerate mutase
MKYFVLIPDGAAGEPMPDRDNRTCLELAATPNLDAMVKEGTLGLARTVPPGMEPSSACACMSVLGYDPAVYYRGRAGIEARSMGLEIGEDEVVFRCNLVTIRDGRMWDYSAGHISTGEAAEVIESLNKELGTSHITFHPGIGYRHILKLKGFRDTLDAVCTPPHDIPGKPVAEYLPQGPGGQLLNTLMTRSQDLLRSHRINVERHSHGDVPVSSIWLFWGSGRAPEMPSFKETYGIQGAITSGVDLLRGLAMMAGMTVLDIEGVTDGLDTDYAAQAEGAIQALDEHDMVVIHVEAPDDAGHDGLIDEKIKAIEYIDAEIIGRLISPGREELRVLVMPDHPTPITSRTHNADPVPFLLWGDGIQSNGAARFTESEAARTGLFMEQGYKIMGEFL